MFSQLLGERRFFKKIPLLQFTCGVYCRVITDFGILTLLARCSIF